MNRLHHSIATFCSLSSTLLLIILLTSCGGSGSDNPAPNDITQNNNPTDQSATSIQFVDITNIAGFNYQHGYTDNTLTDPQSFAGGVAAGDYDNDGLIDFYIIRGTVGPNLLYKNQGNNVFTEVAASTNLAIDASNGSGPLFVDIDGDNDLDLFIGAVENSQVMLFSNNGDSTFTDITATSGFTSLNSRNTVSAAAGDYDLDGHIDLFLTHWDIVSVATTNAQGDTEHLWRNNGDTTFTNVSMAANISSTIIEGRNNDGKDYTFTPNFADINNDRYPDLLIAADFATSQVFLNNQNGSFTNTTGDVISDENGMGASVGDYDNDGDLDWFVTSISETIPNANINAETYSGNRLYRNTGDGGFEDVTIAAGVRYGDWGWGSCFADFNNDGFLDILQLNGWRSQSFPEYLSDKSKLFMANADGSFTEIAIELGLDDPQQGRGLVCADTDLDGDIDVFIANNQQAPRLYRNDGGNTQNYLAIKLTGLAPNTQAVGARIHVMANGIEQMRELRIGSNYVSQNDIVTHFGLAQAQTVDQLRIVWPDGITSIINTVNVNQRLVINHPDI